jgi:orotidine-5'-phosphate decarboxylase
VDAQRARERRRGDAASRARGGGGGLAATARHRRDHLTSLSVEALERVGLSGPLDAAVERLARLAADCGLDGVVCSALEAARLRAALGRVSCSSPRASARQGPAADDQARGRPRPRRPYASAPTTS